MKKSELIAKWENKLTENEKLFDGAIKANNIKTTFSFAGARGQIISILEDLKNLDEEPVKRSEIEP